MPAAGQQEGFSLLEIMIGMFLSSLLIAGIVQLLVASASAYRLQLSMGQLEESGRYARDVLATHITQAGFRPEPWDKLQEIPALTDETLNGGSFRGDQLGLQRWSSRNCFGTENPATDGHGKPLFYLLQTRFRVNRANNLTITCRYGPGSTRLKTQINNFGLVENVESMQLLFAEDRDGNEIADGWVTGQAWQQEQNIRAIKVALLIASSRPFAQATNRPFMLLDENVSPAADGRLRRVSLLTSAIRGRLK